MKNVIDSITPFTTIDYADHLACIAWFSGCNMRCLYCYNPQIVLKKGKINKDEFLEFLKTRQNLLDAVVLSGGECTLFSGLLDLCKEIKKLGFKIKIDTNGSNPDLLKNLIENDLIDFIALDFKSLSEKYFFMTKSHLFFNFEKSLEFLIEKNFNFEVRTTLHTDLLNENDINKMIDFLLLKEYKGVYYLQRYLHVKTLGNLNEEKNEFDFSKIKKDIKIEFRNV